MYTYICIKFCIITILNYFEEKHYEMGGNHLKKNLSLTKMFEEPFLCALNRSACPQERRVLRTPGGVWSEAPPPDPGLLSPCLNRTQLLPPHSTPGSRPPHLPPGFDALVHIVGEGAAGGEAAGPLGHVQAAVLQHDLALADDHQGSPAQLHAFKDVILRSLGTGRGTQPWVWAWEGEKDVVLMCLRSCLLVWLELTGHGSQEKPTMHLQGLRG